MTDVDGLFKQLSKASGELNEARDSVSRIIELVNAKLKALNFGEPYSEDVVVTKQLVQFHAGDEGEVPGYLAYAKPTEYGNDAVWQLCILYTCEEWEGSTYEPLLSQSFETRVAAIQRLPNFLKSMTEAARRKALELQAAIPDELIVFLNSDSIPF